MDRPIVYAGALPLETDILNTNRDAMVALGMMIRDVLGAGTLVSGFACAPTIPGSLAVNVAAGRIYALENLDSTAYSSLAADTTHTVMKQGIALDTTQLALAAPATSGFSANYLIEAAFSEVDSDGEVLAYYNASNPAQPYSGPNNTGETQYTTRKGTVVLTAKAGVAATTGSQTTPAPDSGNVGMWVVTVANGQSAITSGNISQYNAGAAWIQNTLNLLAPLASPALTGYPTAPTPAGSDSSKKLATTEFVTSAIASVTTPFASLAQAIAGTDNATAMTPRDVLAQHLANHLAVTAGGTANALTATLSAAPQTALADRMRVRVRAAAANTGAATLDLTLGVVETGALPINKGALAALEAGDIAGAGHELDLQYNGTAAVWLLLNPATASGSVSSAALNVINHAIFGGF